MPGSDVAESCGRSICGFLRNPQMDFHNGGASFTLHPAMFPSPRVLTSVCPHVFSSAILSAEKLKSQSSVNLRFPVEVADDRSGCDGNRPCGLTKINVNLKSREPVYTFCLCIASGGSAMSYLLKCYVSSKPQENTKTYSVFLYG